MMMKNRIYLNGKTRFLSSTPDIGKMLYNLPSSVVTIQCSFSEYSDSDLVSFIKSFKRKFRLDLGKHTHIHSIACLFILHYVLYVIHDSRYMEYLYHQYRSITLPQFLMPILEDICMPVISRSKVVGTVKGEVVLPAFEKPTLFELEPEQFSRILTESGLTMFLSKSSCIQVRMQIENLIRNVDFNDRNSVFKFVTDFLQELDSICLYRDLPMETMSLSYSTSDKYGIYRFRNSGTDSVYYVDQSSIANLNIALLNLFASFLGIYKPSFMKGTKLIAPEMISGDGLFDLTGIDTLHYWDYYISGQSTSVVTDRVSSSNVSNGTSSNSSNAQRSYSTTVISSDTIDFSDVVKDLPSFSSLQYYKSSLFSNVTTPTRAASRSPGVRYERYYVFGQPGHRLYKLHGTQLSV